MHRRAFAGKRHLHSKCRCPTQHNPTNTKQSFMTCPILKRPADCTRPGPSRLSFTPKPRPKQCVGELEIPGLPSTARTLFSGLRVSTHGKQAGPLVGFYHSAGRQPANSTPLPAGGGSNPGAIQPINTTNFSPLNQVLANGFQDCGQIAAKKLS